MPTAPAFLSALLVLSAFACQSEVVAPGQPVPEVVTATLGTEFELRLGQSARVGDTGVSLVFQSVAEDSRCPTGVTCVWEGNGRVLLGFHRGDGPLQTTDLNTTLDPHAADVLGIHVELVALLPWPVDGVARRQEDYVLRLKASGS